MSGIKGFPSQKKVQIQTPNGFKQYNEFVTVQPSIDDRNGLDVISRLAFRVGAVQTAEAGSTKQIMVLTAHGALAGDFVRFEGTSQFPFFEVPIVEIIDANSFYIGTIMPIDIAITDTFFIMRYVTQRTDNAGATLTTSGPATYQLNGIDTIVAEDTVVPANSRSFPVGLFSPSGERLTSTASGTRRALDVSTSGKGYLDSARLDYSLTNVDDTNWTQVLASTGASETNGITLFDGGGFAMELGIGAAASEARMLLIPPGGFNGVIPIQIPAGSRLSVRALGATLVNAGEIDINLLG